MSDVSLVGLGSMGGAIARRLIDEGHRLMVWNRTASAADALVAAGALRAASLTDAFRHGPVLSMLSDDRAVDSVFSASALAGAGPGAVHVNMATVSLTAARELTERHAAAGVGYVAAPVLGRPPVAAGGQLNILVGGDAALVESLAPIFGSIGKQTWRLGPDPWQANIAKISMNYLLAHAIQALAEGLTLAERHGLDATTMVELMGQSFFPGPVYQTYGTEIADRSYQPAAFTTVLGRKDVSLAAEAAKAVGLDLPAMSGLLGLLDSAVDQGRAQDDWACIAEVLRSS